MDKGKVKGAANVVKGRAETKVGKTLGNSRLEENGKTHQTRGKLQYVIGWLKEKLRRLSR